MPPFSAVNDSVRCCCQTRRSCWMSSFVQCCFQWFGLIYCCCSGVVRVFFGHNIFFIPPGTWCWYYYGLLDGTAPNRSIHATKSAGSTFIRACGFFFDPILAYFLRMTLSSSLRSLYPGSHGTHSSPSPTAVLARDTHRAGCALSAATIRKGVNAETTAYAQLGRWMVSISPTTLGSFAWLGWNRAVIV